MQILKNKHRKRNKPKIRQEQRRFFKNAWRRNVIYMIRMIDSEKWRHKDLLELIGKLDLLRRIKKCYWEKYPCIGWGFIWKNVVLHSICKLKLDILNQGPKYVTSRTLNCFEEMTLKIKIWFKIGPLEFDSADQRL